MSLKEYIEKKNHLLITTSLQEYSENLQADLASLLLKPTEKTNEAKKNSISLNWLYKKLSEIHYPKKNEMCIAMSSANIKRIIKSQNNLHEFKSVAKNSIFEEIDSYINDYKVRLFTDSFTSEDIDAIYNACLYESNLKLEKVARNLELAISYIPSWKNCSIHLEGLKSDNYDLEKIQVSIGDDFPASFALTIEDNTIDNTIDNINEENASSVVKNNILELIKQLKQNPKYNQILDLYMVRPLSERNIYDNLKRDLAIGIKSILSNHIILTNLPVTNNEDVYLVKIEEQYIKEFMCEGDQKQYFLINEESPVKWIERINYEK